MTYFNKMGYVNSSWNLKKCRHLTAGIFAVMGLAIGFQNCSKNGFSTVDSSFPGTFSPASELSSSNLETQVHSMPVPASATEVPINSMVGMLSTIPATPAPLAKTNFTNTFFSNHQPVEIPGCNAPTWSQIPGMPDYFVGRVKRDAPVQDLNSCANSESYTLAWARMDWEKNKLVMLGKMIDLNVVDAKIQGGKYTLSIAYDPAIMFDGTDYWLAFECHGTGFRGSVGVCMAPVRFTAPGGLDLSRSYLAVEGTSADPESTFLSSGSVPKLLNDSGRIYLYWSAVKMPKTSGLIENWDSITTRGVELIKDGLGRWVPKDFGIEMPSDHPASVEVMGVESGPSLGKTSDGFQVTKVENNYFLVGAVGSCLFPLEKTPGCYRMTIRRADSPLGFHIFNGDRVPDKLLPSNAIQYFHLINRPSDGQLQMIGLMDEPNTTRNSVPKSFMNYTIPKGSAFFHPSTAALRDDVVTELVRLGYQCLLKREPDPEGLLNHAKLLYQGMNQTDFSLALLTSLEGENLLKTKSSSTEDFINRAYQHLLGRAPEAAAVVGWKQKLNSSAYTRDGMLKAVINSEEFYNRFPLFAPVYQ